VNRGSGVSAAGDEEEEPGEGEAEGDADGEEDGDGEGEDDGVAEGSGVWLAGVGPQWSSLPSVLFPCGLQS
jgi:hypothetical protein